MFNRNIFRLLLGSTILSSIFSVIIIAFSVYHHVKIQQIVNDLNRQ